MAYRWGSVAVVMRRPLRIEPILVAALTILVRDIVAPPNRALI
jgi:hypothetical protein